MTQRTRTGSETLCPQQRNGGYSVMQAEEYKACPVRHGVSGLGMHPYAFLKDLGAGRDDAGGGM